MLHFLVFIKGGFGGGIKYRMKKRIFLCYSGPKGKKYLNKYKVKIILSVAAVK